jgi:hypothetical protein
MAKKQRLEIRIDCWVTSEMHDRLQRIAHRDERTVSFVIRRMIAHCLPVLDPLPAAWANGNGQYQQQAAE